MITLHSIILIVLSTFAAESPANLNTISCPCLLVKGRRYLLAWGEYQCLEESAKRLFQFQAYDVRSELLIGIPSFCKSLPLCNKWNSCSGRWSNGKKIASCREGCGKEKQLWKRTCSQILQSNIHCPLTNESLACRIEACDKVNKKDYERTSASESVTHLKSKHDQDFGRQENILPASNEKELTNMIKRNAKRENNKVKRQDSSSTKLLTQDESDKPRGIQSDTTVTQNNRPSTSNLDKNNSGTSVADFSLKLIIIIAVVGCLGWILLTFVCILYCLLAKQMSMKQDDGKRSVAAILYESAGPASPPSRQTSQDSEKAVFNDMNEKYNPLFQRKIHPSYSETSDGFDPCCTPEHCLRKKKSSSSKKASSDCDDFNDMNSEENEGILEKQRCDSGLRKSYSSIEEE